MKYIPVMAAVLVLLFSMAVPACAEEIVQSPATGETVDIPDWALKPAIDPDEEEEPTPTQPMAPITVKDPDGNVIYHDDGTGDGVTQLQTPEEKTDETYKVDADVFLHKPFEKYSVTEGFLLLFLILGFCLVIWKMIKGVF